MDDIWLEIQNWFTPGRLTTAFRVVVIVILGVAGARLLASFASRVAMRRGGRHQAQIIKRLVRYVVLALMWLTVISELGFDIGVLLGAAGLLTVAVGFAAQTSASNLISGLFLLSEGSFVVGDTILVGSTTGEVLSIDLLSVKLRTFDNLYVRVPNELVLKSEVRNLSRFPIRRLDISITVPYGVDFPKVRGILRDVATKHPFCLDEPAPVIFFTDLSDRGYVVQYSVWASRERFADVRASVHGDAVAALGAQGIEIPMPRQQIFAGDPDRPFAVRSVASEVAKPGTAP